MLTFKILSRANEPKFLNIRNIPKGVKAKSMGLDAPLEMLRLVTPFPDAKSTRRELRLSEVCGQGQPVVLHMYTG
jgi:hypothetical protein